VAVDLFACDELEYYFTSAFEMEFGAVDDKTIYFIQG
jgi:hypothetical protein